MKDKEMSRNETKLGSVEQLTQGMPILAIPDDTVLSV